MKKNVIAGICCLALASVVTPALAEEVDAELCLDCHEPAEDWEGMSMEDMLADAKDPTNKRHKDNQALSEEQLRQILGELLAE